MRSNVDIIYYTKLFDQHNLITCLSILNDRKDRELLSER